MTRRNQIEFTIAFGILTLITSCAIYTLRDMHEAITTRTVRGQNASGAFVAIDEIAIAKMTNPDPYPANAFNLQTPVPMNRTNVSGLVFVPNGVKAKLTGRKFLVHGQFVDPVPASTIDMMKADAVEMDRIKIIEGPQRGVEGWVRAYCLRMDWRYP